jgi:hypothetical protein
MDPRESAAGEGFCRPLRGCPASRHAPADVLDESVVRLDDTLSRLADLSFAWFGMVNFFKKVGSAGQAAVCAGFDFFVCSRGMQSFFAPGVRVLCVSSVSKGLQVQQFRGWREGIGTAGYLRGLHRSP